MIRHLNRRIQESGSYNVLTVLADPDNPFFRPHSLDRVFICNTWHHIDDRMHYLELIGEALKPGGQVVMIDYKKEELPVGPPLTMKISRVDLIEEMSGEGFPLCESSISCPASTF